MGFTERLGSFLGMPSKQEIEKLEEHIRTTELLLRDIAVKPSTSLSSQARESTIIEDCPGLVSKRVKVKDLQQLYLANQFIFRGVNVRADETITRGYKIIGDDDVGIKSCQELIENSGGENLFKQYSINTDVSADGYLEKVPNESGDKLMYLKHLNPLNFGFALDRTTNKIIIGEDGKPKGYEQVVYDDEGKMEYIFIDKSRIAHLRFNTFADEFRGVSSLQPVYNTAIRLMNMEHAAANAAVKSANPIIVGKTKTKSPRDLSLWSQVLSNISAKEQVFLPDGVELVMMSPGQQNFSAYSEYFLAAVVAALGVPKAILTGSSDAGGGSRSTVTIQSRHFYSVIRANQRYIEKVFNEDIFKDYAQRAGFKAPKLVFNDIAEDADVNGQRAIELYGSGLITLDEARAMLGLETSEADIKNLNNEESKEKILSKTRVIDLEKKEEKKAWHPSEPGSPEGSQRGIKRKQKLNPDVKSVK